MKTKPRPNLFIIGAMKSGTTSLHYYLGAHPKIFMCEPKEPWYFVTELNWGKSEDWYLSLFQAAGDARIVGESSADYSKIPKYMGVPQRIFQFNPEARFVYLMRDPAARTISHYWHNVRWHSECRDMLTAIRADSHLRDVSNYAMQLAPYFEIFGRDAFYILTFEQMVSDPVKAVTEIYSWLGLEIDFDQSTLTKKINITPQRVDQVKGFGLLQRFRYSKLWNGLYLLFPKCFRNAGRRLAVKSIDRDSRSIEEVLDFLRSIQIQQVNVLSGMLGREFPEWTILYGNSNHRVFDIPQHL